MIQTKTAFHYEDRGDKIAKIKVEIQSFTGSLNDGIIYEVTDWAIAEDGTRTLHKQKTVKYTNEQIDQLDAYIEGNFAKALLGLSKSEKERKKIQLALMIDTQNNLLSSGYTIYRLTPEDWEFSE